MKLSDFPKAGENVRVMVPGTLIEVSQACGLTRDEWDFVADGTSEHHIVDPKMCKAYRRFVVVKGKRGKK